MTCDPFPCSNAVFLLVHIHLISTYIQNTIDSNYHLSLAYAGAELTVKNINLVAVEARISVQFRENILLVLFTLE